MIRSVVLAFLLMFSAGAFAQEAAPTTPANDSQLVEHGSYINSSGQRVHSPAHSRTSDVPTGATAKCRDGTYSFSQHHSGTCSHHGGVENWL
jgi:hypothetical protein